MQKFRLVSVAVLLVLILSGGLLAEKPAYKDSSLSAAERTEDLLGRMTLEEKVEQLSGKGLTDSVYGDLDAKTFGTKANKRLGIPGFTMGHGITGVRVGRDMETYSTYFCTPKGIGASWDRELYYRVGVALAKEMRAYKQDMNLGPTINMIRHPYGGRNWESYSEDPYLMCELIVPYTKAMQSNGVILGPKHFAANNQENHRTNINNVVDERTLHEIYLPAFKAAVVRGGAMNMMGAFNRLNGEYCCSNKELLTDILRKKWGFKGFVLSDFGQGVRSTVDCSQAGLDIEMNNTRYYGKGLIKAVEEGEVSEETVNEMCRRVLFTKFSFGMFDDRPEVPKSIVHCKEHKAIALEVARKSPVLLKNEGGILPVDKDKIKTIAMIGPNVKNWLKEDDKPYYLMGGGSGRCFPFAGAIISPFEGIKKLVGEDVEIIYAQGCTVPDRREHSDEENKPLIAEAVKVAGKADMVILVGGISGYKEAEGNDRKTCTLPAEQEELIAAVTEVNPNTVAVIVAGDYIEMQKWQDKVPGILMAFYCGEKIGQGVAEILFGEVNPSGKLPISMPVTVSQYPDYMYYDGGPYSKTKKSNEYKEGVFVGYRYLDKNDEQVAFPFGHGLSYTTFEYSDLRISSLQSKRGEPVTVTMKVANKGKVEGREIVQLYVSDKEASVARPVKELKGFEQVSLKPGEEKTVKLELNDDAFAFYCVQKHDFVVEPGEFEILIGSSSRDIKLRKKLNITK